MRPNATLFIGLVVLTLFSVAAAEETPPKARARAPLSDASLKEPDKKGGPPEEVIQNLELLQNLPLLKEIDLYKDLPVRGNKTDCTEAAGGCSKQKPSTQAKGNAEGVE